MRAEQSEANRAQKSQALVKQKSQGSEVAYATMLREQLEEDGAMKKHPHVPHAVGESAIALFAKYERTRDGRMRPHEFVKAMQAYGKVLGTRSTSALCWSARLAWPTHTDGILVDW